MNAIAEDEDISMHLMTRAQVHFYYYVTIYIIMHTPILHTAPIYLYAYVYTHMLKTILYTTRSTYRRSWMLSVTAPPVPALHAPPPLPNQACVPVVGHIAIVLVVLTVAVRDWTLYLNAVLSLSFVMMVVSRRRRVRIMTLYMIDNNWLLLVVYMLIII